MTSGPQNRRNHTRINLTVRTIVELGDKALRLSATLLDISLGGARLKIGDLADFSVQQIEVTFNGLRTIADVVWCRAGEIGLRFRETATDAQSAVTFFENVILCEYRSHAPTARAWQDREVHS